MRPIRRAFGALLAFSGLLGLTACAPSAAKAPAPESAPRVLIVGGGASHDFAQWYQNADVNTLQRAGARVSYTSTPAEVLPSLAGLDVLFLSNNQSLPDPSLREGIFNLAREGRGLVIAHAAAWYNWRDWPAYNRDLVGGGARAHRRYGEFAVEVVDPSHPVMRGVPSSFTLKDELYYFEPDATGSAMTVLATAREVETGKVFPIVWTVQHPKARIVVNTLGHDGEAHDHPAYQRILQNSVRWAGQRTP